MKPKIGDTVQFKKSGITGTVEKILRGACVVKTPVSKLSAWPEDLIIVGQSEVSLDKEMEEHQRMCDEIMAIQGIEPIEAEMEQIIHCPEGYIFKDENGNIINTTKIVLEKKKPKYPKTYEECCRIIDIDTGFLLTSYDIDFWKGHLLTSLQKLLICRDAYWKIAGDWKPKFNSDCLTPKYIMTVDNDRLIKSLTSQKRYILAFPTEEMRDAFYENFKELIESCKELL